jgi:type IV pilus secretin PilQ/predicted competence protein
MKILKKRLVPLLMLILPMTGMSQSSLISFEKGGSGQRCWAALTFDRMAVWNGVSRQGSGQLSLYFMGDPGEYINQSMEWAVRGNPRLSIRLISADPPVFSVDISHQSAFPMSIIKSNRHVVISFNEDEFLRHIGNVAVSDISPTPGALVNIQSAMRGRQMITSMEFEGTHEWIGYVQPAGNAAALYFRGADLATPRHEYLFEENELNKISLFTESGDPPGVKSVLFFNPDAAFSIVKRPKRVILQTTSAPAELSEKPDEFETFEVRTRAESTTLDELFADEPVSVKPTPVQPAPVPSAITPDSRPAEEENEWDRFFEERSRMLEAVSPPPKSHVAAVPLPPVTMKPEAAKIEESAIPWNRRVSFEFINAPIQAALSTIARIHNLNIVVADGVEGSVNMDLNNVTLRQALNMIIHTSKCEYTVEEDIIIVRPVREALSGGRITEVFRLRYAQAENIANVIRSMVSNDTLVQIFYPEFFDFASSGANRRQAAGRTVQGVRRSSTLVVTERAEKLREIRNVIAQLDVPPVQILIQSKLLELSPTESNKLGVNWDKTLTMAIGADSETSDFSAWNESPGTLGDMTLGKLTASRFQAVLDFLDERTESQLKSNPSLLAMNNEESSISVGTTVPVPRIQQGQMGGRDMVTFEYKEINIQLNVMPHVTDDDYVTMFVNPVIEEISGWVEFGDNRAPITDKRAVNSFITVKNGETLVIGGLIKTQQARTEKRVWLLGSIPLIGNLFRHTVVEDKQTDLMIFITPTIVRPANI